MNDRRLIFAMFVALLALVCVPASVAKATRVAFETIPGQVFEGQRIALRVSVSPANASCKLSIKYKGGRLQKLQTKVAVGGRVSWAVRVPAVPEGNATATVNCAHAGTASASLYVRLAVQAPKVTIARNGFSQRPHRFDPGSDVNYGLEVHNERTRADAVNVTLLVNIIDATNRVLGTGFVRIPRLSASSVFNVGGQTAIPTQTPVARLEVVVTAISDEKLPATPLLISDTIIAPSVLEPPFVGSVRGQLLNQSPVQMDSGMVGTVIEDANGNIIGGGAGLANGPLSFGAREAFSLNGGFSAVPIASAARALVSVIPSYHRTS